MNAHWLIAAAILPVACGGEEPVVAISEFHSRSPLVGCKQIGPPADELASVTRVRRVSDSTFLVVDEDARQVGILDGDARVLSIHAFPADGPGSIARLLDASASGDSLLVAADGGRNRIIAVTPDGDELWTLELDFPPQAVAIAGQRVLLAAVGMDPRIPGLIHEKDGNSTVPLGISFIHNGDALARLFVNSVTLRGLPDGSAIVAHEMIWPRVWRLPPHGDPERSSMPVPDEVSDRIGYLPPMPMAEEDLDDIAIPVMGLAVDATDGDMFYLTRSGRRAGDHSEKAIIRVDSDFAYLGSIRLPMNATGIAYIPSRPDSLIVVDTDLAWHRCPVPARSSS